MVRRTAAAMALLGFALACLVGALSGCSIETALGRALIAGGAFFLLGLAVGWAGERLLREHFQALAGDEETGPQAGSPPEEADGAARHE